MTCLVHAPLTSGRNPRAQLNLCLALMSNEAKLRGDETRPQSGWFVFVAGHAQVIRGNINCVADWPAM
jgi:hypothetical protein